MAERRKNILLMLLRLQNLTEKFSREHWLTEPKIIVSTWFCEFCSCCCLALLLNLPPAFSQPRTNHYFELCVSHDFRMHLRRYRLLWENTAISFRSILQTWKWVKSNEDERNRGKTLSMRCSLWWDTFMRLFTRWFQHIEGAQLVHFEISFPASH